LNWKPASAILASGRPGARQLWAWDCRNPDFAIRNTAGDSGMRLAW